MKIDVNKIVGDVELQENFEYVSKRVEKESNLFVFKDNKPKYVLMTIEEYEKLADKNNSNLDEYKEYKNMDLYNKKDDNIVNLLNKIGKKIFVDYFYIFKSDINPEDRLPLEFTLNSKRSRSSAARAIFRDHLEIDALDIIINSNRLDEETIKKAVKIKKNETGIVIDKSFNESKTEDIKIGKMIKFLVSNLLKKRIITNEEIQYMKEERYSKVIFNLNYPVLKEVDKKTDIVKQKVDKNGYNRYYNDIITVENKEYLLCSQWIEGLHRTYFESWLNPRLLRAALNSVDNLSFGEEFTIQYLLKDCWKYLSMKTRKKMEIIFEKKVENEIRRVVKVDKTSNEYYNIYKKL